MKPRNLRQKSESAALTSFDVRRPPLRFAKSARVGRDDALDGVLGPMPFG